MVPHTILTRYSWNSNAPLAYQKHCLVARNTFCVDPDPEDFFTKAEVVAVVCQQYVKRNLNSFVQWGRSVFEVLLPEFTEEQRWEVMRCQYFCMIFRSFLHQKIHPIRDCGRDKRIDELVDQARVYVASRNIMCEPPSICAQSREIVDVLAETVSRLKPLEAKFCEELDLTLAIETVIETEFPHISWCNLKTIVENDEFAFQFVCWHRKATAPMVNSDAIIFFLTATQPKIIHDMMKNLGDIGRRVLKEKAEEECVEKLKAKKLKAQAKRAAKQQKAATKAAAEATESCEELREKLRACKSRLSTLTKETQAAELDRDEKVAKALEIMHRNDLLEQEERIARQFAEQTINLGIEEYERQLQAEVAVKERAARLEEHAAAETAKHSAESARRREVRAAAKVAKEARDAKEAVDAEARERVRAAAAAAAPSVPSVAVEDPGESARAKRGGRKEIGVENRRQHEEALAAKEARRVAEVAQRLEKVRLAKEIGGS